MLDSNSLPIGIILLAAGASRRMGTPKQLLKIGEVTLIERAIDLTQSLKNQHTVVVLGANAAVIQQSIKTNDSLNHIINENWQKGSVMSAKKSPHLLELKETSAILWRTF